MPEPIEASKLLSGQWILTRQGQQCELAQDIGVRKMVEVYPFSKRTKTRSRTRIPIPVTYIVTLLPDTPVSHPT